MIQEGGGTMGAGKGEATGSPVRSRLDGTPNTEETRKVEGGEGIEQCCLREIEVVGRGSIL
jgi:hypothetical protein